ncbi:DUF1700 domain-containing protein [Falsibacillus pallidus]|uniref:DUF1700 domain-containing protein n=1 Tax=Falsibacillus pallidus TaxID=493781 RepID=UPI003D96E37F
MAGNEFLAKLENLLGKLPESERREMLYDYEEHFEIGLSNGRTEKEIMEELGDPHVIARDLLADYRIFKAEETRSVTNIFQAATAAVSLSFFNLVFILGPLIGLAGVYAALCAVALVLTISPFALLGSSLFNGFENIVLNLFASLALFSLGLLLCIGMIYVGKFFYRVILTYIKFNVRLVKGKGEKAA